MDSIEKANPNYTSESEVAAGINADLGLKKDTLQGAKNATDAEHNMTLLEGIRLYPKAIAFSIAISTCIAMEGYDVCLINNFYGFPQFNRKYGELLSDGKGGLEYQIPAPWQSGLSNGANVGEIFGLILNGWISERFGYRKTLIGCLLALACFITIFFTAQNVQQLLAAEILCGIPWGVFQTLCITYASETMPVALRGYLTTYVNLCWGLGQLIGIGVIKSMVGRDDEWSYRIPYALQWMWIPPLLVGAFLAPESPWWLVRKGRIEEAKKSLLRLTSRNSESEFNPDETIDMMQHTTQLEEKITAGASYFDCFKGVDLRRTEIVMMAWATQNLSGNAFSNYSTYFLQQAGVGTDESYSFALGQYAINMVGVFGAWGLMSRGIGRRSLYFYGLIGLCTMLMIMGFLGLLPESKLSQRGAATGGLMIFWALVYQLTVGTVCYSLVSEISTRRLQIKTVVLGRAAYIVVGIITSVLTPYMINPSSWNWQNFTGFFWAGLAFLCIIYTYFRIPEPRGRTFAELDFMFERKISARNFAKAKVDVFADSVSHAGLAMNEKDGVAAEHNSISSR